MIKDLFLKSKKFINIHSGQLRSGIEFTGKLMEEVANITQLTKSSPASYISSGFKIKKHYQNAFARNVEDFFLTEAWEPVFCPEVWPVAAQILERGYANKIECIKREKNSSHLVYICHLPGDLTVGWYGSNSTIDSMYISSGKQQEINELLEKEVWHIYKTDCLTIGVIKHNWQSRFSINEEETHSKFVECGTGTKYANIMKRYQEEKIGRAMLFYGPPGSGKSNIIKAVSNSLKLKTVRLQNLDQIRNKAIVSILDVFNPDAIILEDIDHLYSNDISSLLEKLENFNIRGKYVLATANEIGKINGALLRPGRFDELVEITSLSKEAILVLLNGDEEIYEIVKTYPVAFIMEMVKRIKIIGREEALASIGDIKKRVEFCNKAEYKL